ncbi:hypothetical protein [Nostoc sp.]|uniref:hypothetical protein n=1 Tax=Nostoc sp. TaxID=1180 RepID=UPI002FF4683E
MEASRKSQVMLRAFSSRNFRLYIVFALSRVFWLSLLSLLAAGFGFILQIIAGRTLLQLLVSDRNRGQITGLYQKNGFKALKELKRKIALTI